MEPNNEPSQNYAMCPLCHYLNRLPTNPTRYRGPQPVRWTNKLIPRALTSEAQK